ncbi:protein translocase subunit SecF, partial [Streptomyces sp. SKN60]|nr:protein translocase subunit SecF [Streptomyces sp. SKN60]
PLVADLKEREPAMKALKKRVLAKRAAAAAKGEALDADPADVTDAEPAVVGQHGRRGRSTGRRG